MAYRIGTISFLAKHPIVVCRLGIDGPHYYETANKVLSRKWVLDK